MEPDSTLKQFKQDQQAEYIKQNKRTGSIQPVSLSIYLHITSQSSGFLKFYLH